jgi:hypothetical protein
MNKGVKILSILLAEAPPSPQLYVRPWEVNWRDGYTDQLLEATNDGANLSSGAIRQVATEMLVPAAAHGGAVNIANGFGFTRSTVTLVVETEDVGGRKTQEIISGYTDHMGIGGTDTNPTYNREMRFFFNHMGTLQITSGSGHEGYGMYQFGNATEILTPMTGWDSNGDIPIVNRKATTMRPKDVMASLGEGAFAGMGVHDDNGSKLNGAPVLGNTSYQFGSRAKRSSFDNNVSSEFLSRVFTGVRDTMLDNATDQRQYGNALQKASESKYINEPMTSNSAMLLLLQRRSQFQQEWSVTLGELLNIDHTITSRIQPIKMRVQDRQTAAAIMTNTDGWESTSFEGQVAQLATLIMPNAMSKFALGHLHFIAHTETLDGSVDVRVVNMAGIAQGIDPRSIINMIKQHIAFEIFPALTMGRFKIHIEANVSLNRISTITVGINGGIKKPFPIASYCSALYSPCLAPNPTVLEKVAGDLSGVASQLTAAAMNLGPGLIHSQPPAQVMDYGSGSIASTPLSNVQFTNPNAAGQMPGGGTSRGF